MYRTVLWGRCCQLIATVYENGGSKQTVLTNFHDFFVDRWTREEVEEKFPGIKVDWLAIDRALAQGPPGILVKSTPAEHLDMATVEHYLRKWADGLSEAKRSEEANLLRLTANILTGMRAEFYWTNSSAQWTMISPGYGQLTPSISGQHAPAVTTGLSITVCHFPPGASKWNQIEHRLFSHITHPTLLSTP